MLQCQVFGENENPNIKVRAKHWQPHFCRFLRHLFSFTTTTDIQIRRQRLSHALSLIHSSAVQKTVRVLFREWRIKLVYEYLSFALYIQYQTQTFCLFIKTLYYFLIRARLNFNTLKLRHAPPPCRAKFDGPGVSSYPQFTPVLSLLRPLYGCFRSNYRTETNLIRLIAAIEP